MNDSTQVQIAEDLAELAGISIPLGTTHFQITFPDGQLFAISPLDDVQGRAAFLAGVLAGRGEARVEFIPPSAQAVV
jgi:hypothetical protein